MMRGSFIDNLYSTLGQFIRLLKLMNKEALILFTFIILAFLLTAFLRKIKQGNTNGIIELNLLSYSITCCLLTWLYLILAYSKEEAAMLVVFPLCGQFSFSISLRSLFP